MGFGFFIKNVLLGVALAMDAFSVSVANGLNEPCMKKRKVFVIAGIFAVFQALMPLIGWICVHTIVHYFNVFSKFIPYIALVLLSIIGGKMIYDGLKNEEECCCQKSGLGFGALLVQGIATSIDALSAGFTIEGNLFSALVSVLIIAVVTFAICLAGILIGKTAGSKFCDKAGIFGGIILIAIGLQIFLTGTGILGK